MKILIISPTQSGIGGIAQHVQGLNQFLKNNGHQVEIISSENTFTIPIKGLKNPSFMISSFLKSKFKKNQDIVHAHNIPAALAMKNTVGKKILSLHGIFSQQIDELHGKITGDISKKYEKDALKWADAITVVSKEAFDYYARLGYNVYQIPNAIDISSLTSNKDRRYQKQIIFAGRLSHEKGIDLLIELAQKLPLETDLIILGSGPEEKKIQNLIKIQKNVHFLGYQNKEKTISLIRGSDILIQPSLNEGISSTILEAMACKTLVIATNVGGNQELITDNETGFLVNSNSTSQIIEKINYVLSNPLKSEVITNNAFTHVKQYDWNVIGKKYLNLYQKVLD
jgi:glycosyltransferase involved in cell wall biosynthesis